MFSGLAALVLVLLGLPLAVSAADAASIEKTFDAINQVELRTSSTMEIKYLVLQLPDAIITLDSGRLAFMSPVTVDSEEKTIGAYFEGLGRFQFVPPNEMEKGQLQRFFDSPSVNQVFGKMLFFFTGDFSQNLANAGVAAENKFDEDQIDAARERRENFQKGNRRPYMFPLLSNLLRPEQTPFFLINAELDDGSRIRLDDNRIYYEYDPQQREPVKLYKYFRRPGRNYMELVSSYWPGSNSETYADINGDSKERIRVIHYDADVTVDKDGNFSGVTEMEFEVALAPTQLLELDIHPRLHVDSVVDLNGNHLPYTRYDRLYGVSTYESEEMGLILNRPLNAAETYKLKFYCQGNLQERRISQYLVDGGRNWYPRYGQNQAATFDMTFRTPKKYTLIATGKQVDDRKVKDMLVTTWKVEEPAANVTFNIGDLKKYSVKDPDLVPIDIYYLHNLHKDSLQKLTNNVAGATDVTSRPADEGGVFLGVGRDALDRGELVQFGRGVEKRVADDVLNSMKLFQHYFGPYQFDRMCVGEIFPQHGDAYPGFLCMCASTWLNADNWGWERIFRAHQVAHQWWGVGVGHETYHDRWLNEGLCEYSALMYYQAAEGNDKFLDRIRDYKEEIYTTYSFMAKSGEEFGPIALGDRTRSITRAQDYDQLTGATTGPPATTASDGFRRGSPDMEQEDASRGYLQGFGTLKGEEIETTRKNSGYKLAVDKKAALVIHMLRNILIDFNTMNEDTFFSMMKEFYETNRGRNVTTAEFQKVVEKYAGFDMGWFFDQWVYRDELPTYQFSYEIEPAEEGGFNARCRIITTGVRDDFMMIVPLEIEIDDGKKAYIRTYVDALDYEFTLPGLPIKPKRLRLNPFESVLAKVKQ